MPPPPKPILPKAAKPHFSAHFDAWNSSSSGHQRPDNQPGTGWRESRNVKLTDQFRSGSSGGERLSDTWGAGSPDWDDERKVVIPRALRDRKTKQQSVADMLVKPGRLQEFMRMKDGSQEQSSVDGGEVVPMRSKGLSDEHIAEQRRLEDELAAADATSLGSKRKIFDGVIVYVNGSTFPLISDHKLKHLLSENGGNMSLHLGRRKVTHVILGRPAGVGAGAGGGLAGSKIEKEIKRIGGCGVKFVDVEWVLESLKAGKRLPEARFSNLKVAAQGQRSVYERYAGKAAQPSLAAPAEGGKK